MLHEQIDLAIAEREAWVLRRQLGTPNNRQLWVLACMDERLPVEEVLGIKPGDAHVSRNAGGLVTDDALRSAVLTTNFFGSKEIIVVNHTECGMLSATNEFIAQALRTKYLLDSSTLPLDPAIPDLGYFPDEKAFTQWFRMFDNVDDTTEKQVQILRDYPLIPKDVKIHGYVYEVETGRLRKPHKTLSNRVNTAQQTGARS